jgi:hypothetical protein
VKGVKAVVEAAPSVPDGALSGVFSVSSTKQVYFSKGNLQATYDGSTWSWDFAKNQWDYIGADNNKVNGNGSVSSNCTIDVFGWSTSSNNFGIHNSKTDGDYSGDFVDWGTAIGSGWRTLTHDEWNFLLQSRTTTSGLLFAKANLFGTVHGLILFPDNYTHPDGLAAITAPNDATGNAGWNGNQYTAEEWAKMEAAGAVFLPAAGCREGTTNHNFNVIGYYHTATPADANNSYDVAFHASVLEFDWNQPNHWAFSVRLVQATSDAAPAEPAYTMAKDATSTDIGKLICTDGHIHAYGEDAECTKDRVAMIAYVGNASDCSHGLAIALQDESGLMDWSTAGTTCSGKTPTVTDGTWRLPSIMDWQYMLIGCGHNGTANANIPTDSYMVATGLFAKLSAAGGDEFIYWIAGVRDANYWMSTENSGNTNQAWRMHFNSKDEAGFHNNSGKVKGNFNVRACLAF